MALRVEHAQCWCLSCLPLRDATAVPPSRLGTDILVDVSLMQRYSGRAAAAQRDTLSLCSFPPFLSVFVALEQIFNNISYTLSPAFSLTPFLVYLPLFFSSSIRPSTSLSQTLVATLKTVVTMVTAMCCGNVKELFPPRITSLFNTCFLYAFQPNSHA